MYYVIKQQHTSPLQHFVGFIVEKYIVSKTNENIIFEFKKDGKQERKWVKKNDIILLTQDKEFFLEIFNQFKATQSQQQELVNQAKEQLDQTINNFASVMHEDIDKFNELKLDDDIPCIMKDF